MPAVAAGALFVEGTIGYAIAYAVVTIAINYGLSKLAQSLSGKPRRDGIEPASTGRTVSIRGTIEPRQLIYGDVQAAGVIIHTFVSGLTDNVLFYVVAFAGHQIDSFVEFNVSGVRIPVADIDGSGTVQLPHFLDATSTGKLTIGYHEGRSDQTCDSTLNFHDVTLHRHSWDATHKGAGIAYAFFAFAYDETIWATGAPQSVYARMRGRRLYDPRLDSSNGGSGSHRYTDATTWEWSDNFALCVRDYITGGSITYDVATPKNQLGMAESNTRIDDTFFVAAANSAEELVDVPLPVLPGSVTWTNGSASVAGLDTDFRSRLSVGDFLQGPDAAFYQITVITSEALLTITPVYAGSSEVSQDTQWNTIASTDCQQDRYTCNTQLSCGTIHLDNLQTLLSAGAGHISYVNGKYRLYAGVYTAPEVDLTADDVLGDIAIATHPLNEKLFNFVSGTFFDPDRGWTQQSFPAQTQTTYQTDDGDLYTRHIDLNATTDIYRAQRIANLHLLQSRNKTTVTFSRLSPKAVQIAEWDRFTMTISEYGWVSQVMRCLEWTFEPDGWISIVAELDGSSAYDDLDVADYQLPRNTNFGVPFASAPVAPNALTTTSFPTYVKVLVGFAETPPPGTIIKVYEHTSSTPFSSATLAASGADQYTFEIPKRDTTTRYYWAVAVMNGQNSTNYPASTGTSGVADLNQTLDIAVNAATNVYTATSSAVTVSGSLGSQTDCLSITVPSQSVASTVVFTFSANAGITSSGSGGGGIWAYIATAQNAFYDSTAANARVYEAAASTANTVGTSFDLTISLAASTSVTYHVYAFQSQTSAAVLNGASFKAEVILR